MPLQFELVFCIINRHALQRFSNSHNVAEYSIKFTTKRWFNTSILELFDSFDH